MARPVTYVTIPFLTGEDDLRRCLASIDADVTPLIIDNSEAGVPDDIPGWVLPMPHNLGVAASWNLGIKSDPTAPYWLFANHDTVLAPGDLDRLIAEMEKGGPRWVGMNGDWRVMGLTREAVETVGWFDENYHPIYCEDADYERRCTLAGVPWYFIPGGATHVGSATIRDPRYGQANARTYPDNVAYHRAKWGGGPRAEVYTTPFDQGGSVADWRLDLDRLRRNAWP
jgi:GT2 family glycosyltransferase